MPLIEASAGRAHERPSPTRLTPEIAYVLSRCEAPGYNGTVVTEHVASVVKTRQGRNPQIRLAGGRLLGPADLAGVLAALEDDRDQGWLPRSVFWRSRSRFAWHLPGAVRPMGFVGAGGKTHTLTVPWPDLVLIAHRDGALQVFALAAGQLPTKDAPVHHAPLMNLSASGAMCWGSATQPAFELASIPAYEDALLRTRFSHVNHPQTFAPVKPRQPDTSDALHLQHWTNLQDTGAERFPNAALNPAVGAGKKQLTLDEVLTA